jgi:hypothetical protein
MIKTNQPESAFPSTFRSLADPDGEQQVHRWGMELRDYFAAKAMQGEVNRNGYYERDDLTLRQAENAYKMADAMLKARSI